MDNRNFPSKYLEEAVDEFAKLPGIGRKTALRLVLHLLRLDPSQSQALGNSLIELTQNVKHCKICNNLSDSDICNICNNPHRDHSVVCVVESIKEVMAIENTQQFRGRYHVLGGVISPMDGIGPGDLQIDSLENYLNTGNVNEIIFALSTTMEGDTTNYYLYKRFNKFNTKITTLARGVSIGDEIEYTDELTLGRSLINRTLFESTLNFK